MSVLYRILSSFGRHRVIYAAAPLPVLACAVMAGCAAHGAFGGDTPEGASDVSAERETAPNVTFVFNAGWSARRGREAFPEVARRIVKPLPMESRISFLRDGVPPEPGLSNLKRSEANGVIDGFVRPTVEQGSDPAGAVEQAVASLHRSRHAARRPLILCCWDDMRADKRGARPAIKARLDDAKDIDAVVLGVAPELADALRRAWTTKFKSLQTFTSDDRPQAGDIVDDLKLPKQD